MADEEVQAEDSAAEFASSLRDLTTNSKTLINMLTILAEESRDHAAKIVEAIESYLRTVSISRASVAKFLAALADEMRSAALATEIVRV